MASFFHQHIGISLLENMSALYSDREVFVFLDAKIDKVKHFVKVIMRMNDEYFSKTTLKQIHR